MARNYGDYGFEVDANGEIVWPSYLQTPDERREYYQNTIVTNAAEKEKDELEKKQEEAAQTQNLWALGGIGAGALIGGGVKYGFEQLSKPAEALADAANNAPTLPTSNPTPQTGPGTATSLSQPTPSATGAPSGSPAPVVPPSASAPPSAATGFNPPPAPPTSLTSGPGAAPTQLTPPPDAGPQYNIPGPALSDPTTAPTPFLPKAPPGVATTLANTAGYAAAAANAVDELPQIGKDTRGTIKGGFTAAGTGLGAAAGSVVGLPGVGAAVGSLGGDLIGDNYADIATGNGGWEDYATALALGPIGWTGLAAAELHNAFGSGKGEEQVARDQGRGFLNANSSLYADQGAGDIALANGNVWNTGDHPTGNSYNIDWNEVASDPTKANAVTGATAIMMATLPKEFDGEDGGQNITAQLISEFYNAAVYGEGDTDENLRAIATNAGHDRTSLYTAALQNFEAGRLTEDERDAQLAEIDRIYGVDNPNPEVHEEDKRRRAERDAKKREGEINKKRSGNSDDITADDLFQGG